MMQLSPEEERILMQRILSREQAALADLYDLFGNLVYGLSLRILQDSSLAEEATQDCFMKLWQKAEDWKPERGRLAAWLLTIARYTAIDRLRKEQRQGSWGAIDLDEVLQYLGAEESLNEKLDFDLLKEYLQRLPQEQLSAIEMAYFKGMSHTEIAEATQIPLGTIKTRIRDGLQNLRRLLKWDEIE